MLAKEEIKKMESQVKSLTDRAAELERKLEESGESNRIITQVGRRLQQYTGMRVHGGDLLRVGLSVCVLQALRLKQEELNQLMIRHEALERLSKDYEQDSKATTAAVPSDAPEGGQGVEEGKEGGDSDKSRFLLDSRPALGLILLKGKRAAYRDWLDKKDGNTFLKRAQKSNRVKEMLIDKIGQLFSALLIEEEARARHEADLRDRDDRIAMLNRANAFIQVHTYIHASKQGSRGEGAGPHVCVCCLVLCRRRWPWRKKPSAAPSFATCTPSRQSPTGMAWRLATEACCSCPTAT